MIKVASCALCGKFYRTGQIRQVIEKHLNMDNKWEEGRMAVCNNCYGLIVKKQGVASADGLMIDGDSPGYSEPKIKTEKEPPKERKPRGKRVKAKKGILGEETIEDMDKEIEKIKKGDKEAPKEPKKRGRKPKSKDTDPLATEASAEDKAEVFSVINDVRDDAVKPKIDEETGDIVATIADAIETVDSEPTSIRPISFKDKNALKNQVRQALENNPEVLYSKIAEKLEIDEGLVSQLVDELDTEGAG